MGVATTTTEASMSAIQERLDQLSVMLGRITARQDQMLLDAKKMMAALMPITTTTPIFMLGQVLELQTAKPSSSSLFSAVEVVGAGAPLADAVFASAVPTRCSTKCPGDYIDSGYATLVFPASDTTHLPATTSGAQHVEAILAPSMPTRYSTLVLDVTSGSDQVAYVFSSQGNTKEALHAPLEPSVDKPWGLVDISSLVASRMIDGVVDEVFTDVGGLSLFLELDFDSAVEVLNDSPLKDVVWDEELADCIVTHIGGLSLFLEYVMGTNKELERKISTEASYGLCMINQRINMVDGSYTSYGVSVEDGLTLQMPGLLVLSPIDLVPTTCSSECLNKAHRTSSDEGFRLPLLCMSPHLPWVTGPVFYKSEGALFVPFQPRKPPDPIQSSSVCNLILDFTINYLMLVQLDTFEWDPGIIQWPILDNLKLDETSEVGMSHIQMFEQLEALLRACSGYSIAASSFPVWNISACALLLSTSSSAWCFSRWVVHYMTVSIPGSYRHTHFQGEDIWAKVEVLVYYYEGINVKIITTGEEGSAVISDMYKLGMTKDIFILKFRTQLLNSGYLQTESQLISQIWCILDSTTSQTWLFFMLLFYVDFSLVAKGIAATESKEGIVHKNQQEVGSGCYFHLLSRLFGFNINQLCELSTHDGIPWDPRDIHGNKI